MPSADRMIFGAVLDIMNCSKHAYGLPLYATVQVFSENAEAHRIFQHWNVETGHPIADLLGLDNFGYDAINGII